MHIYLPPAQFIPMHLTEISIENFKNYEKLQLSDLGQVVCFTGLNGVGKTNILDAIHLMCTGKSYFTAQDASMIATWQNYFAIRGNVVNFDHNYHLECILIEGKRKVIRQNEAAFSKISEYYGNYPIVMIAPADLELVNGLSEGRRNWLDALISMTDKLYLNNLIQYEKILKQRNAALRQINEKPSMQSMLGIYNEQLIPLGENIYKVRLEFMTEFVPLFGKVYGQISHSKENAKLNYVSTLSDQAFQLGLEQSLRKDIALGRTNTGIHRDEIGMMINDASVKKQGSQGQQKTYLIAIKLAQYLYLHSKKGFAPILLLDDICERLDDERLKNLFSWIIGQEMGQIFITDTSVDRLRQIIDGKFEGIRYYHLQNSSAQLL